MPRLGMEPIRRAALVEATIAEIGRLGSLDVTVGQIAKRAGVSAALAHHYFGGKETLLLAAMRHALSAYGAEVRARLSRAEGHRARLEAIVGASFSEMNFCRDTIATWLNLYVLAQRSDEAMRLLRIYRHRMRSNLLHELKPLLGERTRAETGAECVAAMIDGIYLHEALHEAPPTPGAACAQVSGYLDLLIGDAA
ncbi:transcriptional regulator BetI [Tropicimonas sp. TH_r6]|uniref:choline-binding transcriptional repressor BetI n=1 Tax=Tropicimonas sp. TH_r6 TaxID=3082085 RepID=UPI002953EEA0|nr:transcriptional regulator BetI [Tropicimonas sp. TH_r6]MDV7144416.1 transcriptional regulator BetI [Tropicimonas sp. TH_r6]